MTKICPLVNVITMYEAIKLYILAIALVLVMAKTQASVDINVYSVSDIYTSKAEAEKGLDLLQRSLKSHCDINLEYNLNLIGQTKDLKTYFKSDPVHTKYKTSFGRESLIYFQKDLYNYLGKNDLINVKKAKKSIDIHYVGEVRGHCGFAFPEVQLEKIKSHKLKNALAGNILISKKAMGCGNKRRLLVHEMAHVILQDNPAHMCGNSKCGESNILSVYRRKPADPFSHSPGLDPMYPGQPVLLPSIGTAFNKQQCAAARAFLAN